METAVAIYGSQGTGEPQLEFFCKKDEKEGKLVFKVINPSVWRFDGTIVVTANDTSVFDARIISLRDSEKTRTLNHEYAPGANYQVTYSPTKTPDKKVNASCQAI